MTEREHTDRAVAAPALRSLALLVALACSPPVLARADAADLRQQAWQQHQTLAAASEFHGLKWRSVGPTQQGGRIVDIEVDPRDTHHFYVAYASGGVWETRNNGQTFEPLTDSLASMINGDLAIAPGSPDTLWLGTGENNSSRSSYGGMGMFRSDDGGRTWQPRGLAQSDRIGRVLVHPRDANTVFVAALGKLYSAGGERGIYRTRDGGASWQQVLAPANAWTGGIDLVMDPRDPNLLYAATWERRRSAWDFSEGGEGSGIWKSTDGGDSWTRLDQGLPSGRHVGRIGLDIARSRPGTLYAVIDNQEPLPEAEQDLGERPLSARRLRSMDKATFLRQDPDEIEAFIRSNDLEAKLDASTLIEKVRNDEIRLPELVEMLNEAERALFDTDIRGLEIYRSDDAGASWRRTHEQPIREVTYTYGYYFGQVRVDPNDPETVYTMGVPAVVSRDGGKTWSGAVNRPNVHVDYHAWWINPDNSRHMLVGNDGGVDLSYDGGAHFSTLDAQPVGQFYTVNVDMAEPYNIYGGLQDNGTLAGPSNAHWEDGDDWRVLNGGDGMYVAVDWRDNSTHITGYQFGFYTRNGGEFREVRPREPLGETPLRYNWNTPVLMSGHNQDLVYFGANRVFRSMDKGVTFTAISPDLTRARQRGDVPFATITTLSESPLSFGLIWAGTDDGHVHVSEDGGHQWRELSDRAFPRQRWVSRVHASSHKRERAYLSFNGYRNDEPTAWVLRTEDLGRSWKRIDTGLPAEPVNVVRDDPENPDVVYVGTDRGVYVSLDGGRNWQALAGNLPKVPVHDLVVHPRERELVIGTHGRSVWILDVLPVQSLNADLRARPLHLFPVDDVSAKREWRSRPSAWFDHWDDPDPVVEMPFWSREGGDLVFEVRDGDERLLYQRTVQARPGVNRIEWDLKLDPTLAVAAESARIEARVDTAEANLSEQPYGEAQRLGWPMYIAPGEFSLRLVQGEAHSSTELTVKPPKPYDPRLPKPAKKRGFRGP